MSPVEDSTYDLSIPDRACRPRRPVNFPQDSTKEGTTPAWYQDRASLLKAREEHGSWAAAARAHGVPPRTVQEWASKLDLPTIPPIPPVKWGYGAAQPVKPATREATELVVIGSDFHFPYEDGQAIQSFLNLVQALEPHRVVLNGDLNDMFQLSRFHLGLTRIDKLQEEIDLANDFRRSVRQMAPNAQIEEAEGNHDSRIRTYVAKNARSLVGLRALEPVNLFLYDELQFRFHPGAGFLLRPHFLIKHGSIVRGEAGASAKAELALAGISGTSGHTHRLATYRREGYTPRQWTESGCLCRIDPDYVVGRPNWTRGCVVGEFSTRTDSFVVWEVPFVDEQLRFSGRAF